MPKVLNFGSLNLDYVYQVSHFVKPGETQGAESQAINAGGKGLNQSVALAKAGAEVYHAGCLGIGGEKLEKILREYGVDTSFLIPVNQLQGNAVIQVTPSGENSIVLFGGSNQCISEEQINNTLSSFGEGDFLILQNEINNLPMIIDKAQAIGMVIFLNPSPFNDRLDQVEFGKLDWLLVNEIEAEQFTGENTPEAVWQNVHNRYPKLSLLLTQGSRGSFAFRVNKASWEKEFQRAYPVKAVDTTGAGDTYTGFFISSLMKNLPLTECMRRASMAAAISVMRSGAARSIPSAEEVEKAVLQKMYEDREFSSRPEYLPGLARE